MKLKWAQYSPSAEISANLAFSKKSTGQKLLLSITRPKGWSHSMYSGWESGVISRIKLQSANTVRLTVWHHAKVSNEKWTACETVTALRFNYLIVMQYYFRYIEIAHLSDSVSRSVIGKLKLHVFASPVFQSSSSLVVPTSDGSFINN